jgi:hypothetical protein
MERRVSCFPGGRFGERPMAGFTSGKRRATCLRGRTCEGNMQEFRVVWFWVN